MGQNGANVANAYRVQATSFEEMGAPRGVIEKVLWRIARARAPHGSSRPLSMLKALDQKKPAEGSAQAAEVFKAGSSRAQPRFRQVPPMRG